MEKPILSRFGLLSLDSAKFIEISQDPVKQALSNPDSGYTITDSNKLFKFSTNSPEKTLISSSVIQVSCTISVLSFVTTTGFAFILGEDKEKSGILGIKNCFSLKTPTKIQILARVSAIQLGCTHGALLSSKGELYTWGTGLDGQLGLASNERQQPTLVQAAKIFLIKQVVCGKTFTAFCTEGGFVYIYGRLPEGNCEAVEQRQPYTIRGLSDYFVEKVECNENFIAVMTDKKEAIVIDACMNMNKIGVDVSKIACSKNGVVVVGRNDKIIHEFVPTDNAVCKAQELAESAYFISEFVRNRFDLFSGYFVGCCIASSSESIGKIRVQTLSLKKVCFEEMEEREEGPDLRKKKTISKVFIVLNSALMMLKQNSFFDIKLYVKCKKMSLKKPINLILAPIIMRIMTKSLIIKRTAWKKFLDFVSRSKKIYKIKVLKQAQSLQNFSYKALAKLFNAVIERFEMFEFLKNQKNRFAEKIFTFLSKKNSDVKRQGLICIKKFVQSVKTLKKKLWRIIELTEKGIKLKFIQNLIKNHIIKMKIYNTITQIIDYSSAQSSRVRMLKLFHTWKRNLVSMKIAMISQKYAKGVRAKKMAAVLIQLTRKSWKTGVLGLKNFTSPNSSLFKIIFITNSLAKVFNSTKKPVFSLLKSHNILAYKLKFFLSPLILTRFFAIQSSLYYYIQKRRTIVLLKILTSLSTKQEKFDLRNLFQAFSRFTENNSFYNSQTFSAGSDSPKLLQALKVPVQASSCKTLLKEKPKITQVERKESKISSPRCMKNTPIKRKSSKIIQKPKVLITKQRSFQQELQSKIVKNEEPKNNVQWEKQILALGSAIMSSLLKTYMKEYLKLIVIS